MDIDPVISARMWASGAHSWEQLAAWSAVSKGGVNNFTVQGVALIEKLSFSLRTGQKYENISIATPGRGAVWWPCPAVAATAP